MAEFGENKEFAKFLLMAKTDKAFGDSLKSGDHGAIDAFPGLSPKEKQTLKIIDWKVTSVNIPHDVLNEFKPNIAARICQEIVGPTFATKRCEW